MIVNKTTIFKEAELHYQYHLAMAKEHRHWKSPNLKKYEEQSRQAFLKWQRYKAELEGLE